MKKKYSSVDELNNAQREMNKTCTNIEQEMLGYISNPLSLIFNKGQNSTEGETNTPPQTVVDKLLDYIPMALPVIQNVVLPMVGGKKLKNRLFKSAFGIVWKIGLVNWAFWGVKKGIEKIKTNRSKTRS
jgi:hypothetical protein